MPKEAIDFLEEACNELKSDISKIRSQMEKEHRELDVRMARIEEKLGVEMRKHSWFAAGIGAVIMYVVKEFGPVLFKLITQGGG